MTKRAELADGRVLEFPDDTPMEVIQRVVKEQIAASRAPTPAPVAAAPTAEARLQARQPLKEVEAPGLFDYFTDRDAAIKQARERAAYMQELGQRGALEDIKTQTGFFDRLGDFFSRGLLSTTSSIKDAQRAIEADPELKKQFTEEARRFAADRGVEIEGATTEEDVKKNFLRNAIPYILEKGAESIPGMLAAGIPIPGLGLAQNFGSQGREAAELEGRQDVELSDLGKVAPGALAVTALDQLGLGGIFAAPAKTVLGRIGKAALLEGGTEAIQSAIEYANPRVVTGSDIDAGELFEQAAFGALVGGGIGGGGRGGIEAVSAALNRGKAETTDKTSFADSPDVEQEFFRLVTAETQALRDQNPDLTQRQAYDQVVKSAGKLYDTAIANTMLGAEGATDVPDVDTGMDVVGGVGAGVAPDFEPSAITTGTPDLGEAVAGGLERPISGVSVPDVGEGAGVDTLDDAKNILADKKVKLTTRVDTARQLLNDTILNNPLVNVNDVDQKQFDMAKNQLANGKHGGDPVAALEAVTGKKFSAPPPPTSTDTSGLANIGGLGGGIGETLRASILAKVEAGETMEAGQPSVILQAAKIIKDAGVPVDVDMLNRIDAGVDAARQSGDFQGSMQKFVADTIAQQPTAPEVTAPPLDVQATAPVADAIKSVAAPAAGTIPTIAQASAREVGIAPTPEVIAPPEMVEPTVAETAVVEPMIELTPAPEMVEPTIELTPAPEMVEPTIEPTVEPTIEPTVEPTIEPTIELTPAPTPQEILTDLDSFAVSEAQDRDLDQDAFLEGVDDIRSGREPMSYYDALKAYGLDTTTVSLGPSEGGDVALSRIAGAQWAQGRIAEAQADALAAQEAAPTPAPAEVASEVPPTATGGTGAPPAPPPPPAATGGTGGPAPKKPKVVSNGKPVVLTEAQKRTALAKAKATREKMNRIQKRIAATNDTADVLSGGVDLAKLVRGDKENWALLRGAIDTIDVGRWQLILPTLSTEDIFRILKGRIPGLTEADRIIQQDVTRFQTKEYLRLADELEQVADFLKKYPKAAQALSDLEFATVAYQVDPTKANSAEEYFAKVDGKAKEIRAQIKAEKDPKKKGRLEAKLKNRSKDIESVYIGVPGDERVIGWRDLSRPEFGSNKGKEIFKLLRDGHRRDLEAKYDALRSRLMETKKDEALDEALEKLEAQFKPALEQVIYFPAMRFGSYYARVGTGVNSIFKLFETQTQRNQFVRIMESRGEEVTETGNVEDLRDNFEQVTGGPLKEVLDLFEGDQKDIGALKSQVFDLWLQTMSAGDMRKHMAPRKMRAGYSTDILKNFANFRRSSTNDVKRAKFGYKLRTEISRAKDMVADMPDREKMNAFIKEIELRTLSDLMPPERGNPYWEAAIQFGNKAAFYQYLANPKTALIQLTQLHIVALPMLAQKYGTLKANAALTKYGFSSLGGLVVSPLKAIPRPGNKWTFDWEQPNLLDNPISALKEESDPELYEVLSEGWNEGRDLNLYMDTFANQIGGYGNADPQQRSALQELMRGRVHTAAWRGTTFAFEAMGTLMHQMERVNREATYMAALELAYRENKKKGQPHAEAKKNAIEAAADITLAATFDFSSYNKPRVLNTGVGRLAGQFMSYPYMMTSLLARNMYTAIKVSGLEPGERKAAIQTTTGVLVNIGLYAGLTGVPLYGFFTTIASLLLWAFGDDEEEEGGLSYLDENGNIKATYNIDWWVRNVWIPKTFGPDGTVANLFGLDDDTAEVVARSVEKGPISAITDIDLSNSVALDFLFFVPRESRAETPEGKVVDYTFSAVTGAAGNTVMDYIKAGKDLMNGYTDRALEKLPKLFSSIAKANRFATEGQTNYNRELVGMDKDFWSSDKVILQALSFASTEASQKQQQNYEAKSINVKIEKARADFLNKLRKTALDRYQYGVTPETEAAQQQIVKEWVEFNQTYPTHVIGLDSFYEVQNNAVNNAVESYGTRGLPMDPKGVKTPYLSDIYLRRIEEGKE